MNELLTALADISAVPKHWPIFVIALPDADLRRATIRQQLEALNLPFSFVDAIDGREALPPEYEALVDREGTVKALRRPMADAEYACALSHRLIYQKIVSENLPGAVILEDDTLVGPPFAEFMRDGHYLGEHVIQLFHLGGRAYRFARHKPVFDQYSLILRIGNAWGALGYSISHTGAQFLLDRGYPLCRPADWPCDMAPLHPKLAVPHIVGHPPIKVNSYLEPGRAQLYFAKPPHLARVLRFFTARYWQRVWFKCATRKLT
ncbi:glycosyltransferase family 25 protein [Halovulum sp. GXIMD14793]